MSDPTYRVVLTGASGGLGHAMAAALAPACSDMILAGRDPVRLAALRGLLEAQHAALRVRVVSGDLLDARVRDSIHETARALPVPLDLLINNAGVNEFHEFQSQGTEAIERLLAVNLLAPMLLTQRLLPVLMQAAHAQIVNVGSIFGYVGYPGFAAYCASKFGLRGYSQALRRELADTPVTVRYFAPRAIRTALATPAIAALNRALDTKEDSAEQVARALLPFLRARVWERKLGFPERLYVLLNQLVPAINDGAIRSQLKIIRKYLPSGEPSIEPPVKE